MKKTLILLTILILFSVSSCTVIDKASGIIDEKIEKNAQTKVLRKIKQYEEEISLERIELEKNNEEKEIIIKEKALIDANFICQAPLETTENWKYHEESCEEAALLQTINYEKGREMTKLEAHYEILEMIKWQKENFGGHYDIYADELKKLAMGFYNLSDEEVVIIYNAEIEDIKRVISKGHPVIAPVTAKLLKNKYYNHPGYHMLQVIGYTEDTIITNDNGTRRGKAYTYPIKTFEKALKDAGADIVYLNLN